MLNVSQTRNLKTVNTLFIEGKWFPPVMNGDVCVCGATSFDSVDSNALLAVITMQGSYFKRKRLLYICKGFNGICLNMCFTIVGRFNMTMGALQCASCGERRKPGPLSYIRIGFWPSGIRRLTVLISEEVLRHCSTLVKISPRTSVSAFCRLLTELSRHRPGVMFALHGTCCPFCSTMQCN